MGFGSTGNYSDTVASAYVSAAITVGTTEVPARVGAQNLADRQEIIVYNDSLSTIYYGPSGVTVSGSTRGIPIAPGGFVNLPFGDSLDVYLISGTAGNSIVVQELA